MLPAVARGPHSLGSTLLLARPKEVTITVRSLSARVVMYSGWVAVMCQVNVRNKNIRTVQTRSTGTLQTLTLIPPFLLKNEIPMDYVLNCATCVGLAAFCAVIFSLMACPYVFAD